MLLQHQRLTTGQLQWFSVWDVGLAYEFVHCEAGELFFLKPLAFFHAPGSYDVSIMTNITSTCRNHIWLVKNRKPRTSRLQKSIASIAFLIISRIGSLSFGCPPKDSLYKTMPTSGSRSNWAVETGSAGGANAASRLTSNASS